MDLENRKQEITELFLGEKFQKLTLEEQLKRSKELSELGSAGDAFFIEKAFPLICKNPKMGLINLTPIMKSGTIGGVKNLDLILLLNEEGKIDQDLVKFLRWTLYEKNGVGVFMVPTIGDTKRLKIAAAIVYRVLKLELFDRIILSGQTVGNNERQLSKFLNELENLCISKLQEEGQSQEKITSTCEYWMSKVQLINVCNYIFKKNGKLLPELGFGITGSAAKSQNLWVFRYLALREIFSPETKVYVVFSDDDYGNKNIELDALFHLCGVLSEETEESLNQKVKSFIARNSLQDPKRFAEKVKAIWQVMYGSVLLRSGGYRFHASPESIQALEEGKETQKIFPETLIKALLLFEGDNCDTELYAAIIEKSDWLEGILLECLKKEIQITPSMLNRNANLFKSFLKHSGIIKDNEEGDFAIKAYSEIIQEFLKKAGKGGRVTEVWNQFVSQIWGKELELDQLPYALHGNMSGFLSLESLLAVGFTVETNDNVMAALKGGIVSYSDGVYSHFPSSHNSVVGDQGMLPRVISALIKKMVECEGLKALPKLQKLLFLDSNGRISFRLLQETREGRREYPFFKERIYLPTYEEIILRKLSKIEEAGFIEINESIRNAQPHPVLFFFDPLAVGNNKRIESDLPENERIVPVLTTAGTKAEVECFLEKNKIGPAIVSIEHGAALLFSKELMEIFPFIKGKIDSIERETGFSAHENENRGFYVLELSRRINPEGGEKILRAFKQTIVEWILASNPAIREVQFQSLSSMPPEEVIQKTNLISQKEVACAQNRQYSFPFVIKIPKEADITEEVIIKKLQGKPYEGTYNFFQGATFWYAMAPEVSERIAGEILKEIFPNSLAIALATNRQKISLLQMSDVRLLSHRWDGSFSDMSHFPPGTIRLNAKPEEAVKILFRKLFKTFQELSR